MSNYTTGSAVKAAARITDSVDDALINAAIESASRLVDGYCGRSFFAGGTATRFFHDIKDSMATGVVMRHDRENLLLENQYLAKYKGDWGQRWVTW